VPAKEQSCKSKECPESSSKGNKLENPFTNIMPNINFTPRHEKPSYTLSFYVYAIQNLSFKALCNLG